VLAAGGAGLTAGDGDEEAGAGEVVAARFVVGSNGPTDFVVKTPLRSRWRWCWEGL